MDWGRGDFDAVRAADASRPLAISHLYRRRWLDSHLRYFAEIIDIFGPGRWAGHRMCGSVSGLDWGLTDEIGRANG
jgi:hypothetical protein